MKAAASRKRRAESTGAGQKFDFSEKSNFFAPYGTKNCLVRSMAAAAASATETRP
jgi:hypothetical protein